MQKREKKRLYIISVLILSAIVAFLFAALIDKVPPILDSALAKGSKANITENEELLKVLRSSINSPANDHSELPKLVMLPYKPKDKYYVSSEMYEQNMKFLSENGYTTITLKDFIKKVRKGEKLPYKAVLIYSDTTNSWFYNIAFPILKKYKFTATLGVETRLVGTPGHMTLTQLAELENCGVEISSHSITHPDLTTVNKAQLEREVALSKKILERWGFDVETFIYPYGACNDGVRQAVEDAGYTGARTVGGPHLGSGGYGSYNKALLYEIRAGLPVNNTTFDEFREYVQNDRVELEEICSIHNVAGNNSQTRRIIGAEGDDYKNDSYSSIALPVAGDALKLTAYVPQSGEYNLHFRLKTGSYASESAQNAYENAYEYIIDGRHYSKANGTVKTTGPYENESTTNKIVWGFQHLDNVSLKKGANDIIIVASAEWAILDYLCIDASDKTQALIPQIIPSIDYDGIFDEPTTKHGDVIGTGVFVAMHGYEHQNPHSGSFADEFDGLSYDETLERIQKSCQIFSEANLNPAVFVPPGGKADERLYKAVAKCNLAMLDYQLYEAAWSWRKMKSFDDPRVMKTLRELKKKRPSGIVIHIQDYNKFTRKLLESYLDSTKSSITLRVDDINVKTSADQLRSLLKFRNRHHDRMSLILGVTPRFYLEEQAAFITVFKALWILFLVSVVFSRVFFACLATADCFRNRRKGRKGAVSLANGGGLPKASIVIPMYNEGESAKKAIQSAQNQTYCGAIEIVVIDDGSTDGTFNTIQSEASKCNNLIGIRQQNRGKPSALNNSVEVATGEIIISTDGDSFLDEHAVERIVERFLEDPEVGAVAGFITVSNEDESWITRLSQIEYVIEQVLFRGCQSFTGDVVICPGAIFAARRQLLMENPSSDRTVVEDCDQTCVIHKAGWKVVFAPEATSETTAPSRLKGWINQRLRWIYGYLQVWRLMRNFAVKKPWMLYAYVGYPMTFLVFLALAIPLILLGLFPVPHLLRDLSLYTGFGMTFTLGVNLYSIFLLAPKRLKKSSLPWLLLFPLYEMMVMTMRAYLYITYLRGEGPTMKYGPRTIHALPDQSVSVVDKTLAVDSDLG